MSKFKQTVADIQAIEAQVLSLESRIEGKGYDAIEASSTAEALQAAMAKHAPLVTKSVKIAMETDEDKKLYGPAMIAQVLHVDVQCRTVTARLAVVAEASRAAANPLLEQQKREAREAQEAEERARREGEERAEALHRREAEERALKQQQEDERKELARREQEAKQDAERAAYEHKMAAAAARQSRYRPSVTAP
jgi:hypothetical protein